ncbi:hypothetical protein BU16DRAFT_81507 [Lophium mytilinum]|uniref:Sensor histidine kinase-like protein/response regulator n=1 Tax=Lophium mytilinum TaxID=390894 RepID=A0A6A6QLW9_9PEZI|nr:hypothetical protein BU16DRAFT_81507 [Lophium mytilinum]
MDETQPSAASSRPGIAKKISDSFREREFYRYYQPSDPASGDRRRPPSLPFTKPDAPEVPTSVCATSGPVPSDDKALTAFAQLGAVRLDARRCMLSFFDRKNHYIMAEATRTLSLQTGKALDPKDSIVWGETMFTKGNGLCDYTVKMAMMQEATDSGNIDVTSFIVNDLTLDDRFKDKPYVLNEPRARFYAGVPIRSPNGYSIGSYCIMDDKPRNGLRTYEISFMHEMADTVMRHLEMMKIKEHHRRGGVMVRSLGSFVKGNDTLEDWWQDPSYPWSASPNKQSQPRVVPGLPVQSSVESEYSPDTQAPSLASTVHSRNPSTAATSITDSQPDYDAETQPLFPTISEESVAAETQPLQEQILAPDVKSTFGRAARIVLEATEADGAVFFDASIGTFGGLVEETLDPEPLTETQDWQYDGITPTVERADPLLQVQPSDDGSVVEDKLCEVLGSSLVGSNYPYSMKEKVLKSLLRHYPRGHIFSFDEHGQSFEDMGSDQATPPRLPADQTSSLKASQYSSKMTSYHNHLMKDVKTLHDMFPDARSLALCPMWDSHRSRWFAGAVIWSTDPMRVFTVEQELSYLTAFGNTVMAEVARLDTTQADRAKADFISSISHELRSPLHGILGACGLVSETKLDPFQVSMTQSIESCAQTLLDTINHVLDHAKINNLGNSKSANDIMSLISDVDLSNVAEEVLETVFTGYNFQKSASAVLSAPDTTPNETFKIQHAIAESPAGLLIPSQDAIKHEVAVAVEVNKADNWIFQTQAGAWRRILMNLFGNALKYTEKGFIKVKLQVKPTPSDALGDESELRLVVTDSGRGMSPEYIRDRLFHSFAQENPLSQGTGLGLSIVRNIIDSLGGNIDVQSELGKGTKITVSCRLKNVTPYPGAPIMPPDNMLSDVFSHSTGMKVAVVGFDEMTDLEPVQYAPGKLKHGSVGTIVRKSLESICREWFGMVLVPWTSLDATKPDLFVATERCAAALRAQFESKAGRHGSTQSAQVITKPPPVIVLCKAASSSHSSSNTVAPAKYEQVFEHVTQPCGPRKFGRALSSCLNRHSESFNDQNSQYAVAGAEPAQSLTSEGLMDVPSPFAVLKLDPSTKVKTSTDSKLAHHDVPTNPSSPAVPVSTAKIPAPPPNHVPLHVLAVDDNSINLNLLRNWLLRLSHHPITATNGAEAVEKYSALSNTATSSAPESATNLLVSEAPRFDAVFMDISMPHMNGMEATRQIRAHEREFGLKPAKIIALSGFDGAQAKQEAYSSGIDGFLTKPIRQRDLEAALRDVGPGDENEGSEGTVVEGA